jgi:L-ribulose-5-phosphate 4-epimerase
MKRKAKMMPDYQALKDITHRCNMMLPEAGLVIQTFGNASVADRERLVFGIKPSGVPYEKLIPDDIVIVNFEGKVVEGSLNPSSDTRTHAYLYKKWDHITGIVHTHSTYAVAWAQAHRDIPVLGTTHADHLATDIPCAPVMSDDMIRGDYEYQTGIQIVNCLKERHLSPGEIEMILIAGHGPFTWGETPEKAVYNSIMLEELARMAFLTLQINPNTPRLKEKLIEKHHERKHGNKAYYGQKNFNPKLS